MQKNDFSLVYYVGELFRKIEKNFFANLDQYRSPYIFETKQVTYKRVKNLDSALNLTVIE